MIISANMVKMQIVEMILTDKTIFENGSYMLMVLLCWFSMVLVFLVGLSLNTFIYYSLTAAIGTPKSPIGTR